MVDAGPPCRPIVKQLFFRAPTLLSCPATARVCSARDYSIEDAAAAGGANFRKKAPKTTPMKSSRLTAAASPMSNDGGDTQVIFNGGHVDGER